MKRPIKLCALLLTLSLLLSLSGCALTRDTVLSLVAPTHEEEIGQVETVTPTEVVEEVVETAEYYPAMSGCFNPLFAVDAGDTAVIDACYLRLGEMDSGTVTGAENEDGSFTVTVELPGNLRYSDGESMDIDDLLFTLYVLLDESYTGPNSFRSLPIVGLQDYYRGVSGELWEQYSPLFDELYNDGRYDQDLQKKLKETQVAQPYNDYHEMLAQKALDEYEQDKAQDIRQALLDVWREDADYLVDYCLDKFAATVEYHTGYTMEQLQQDRRLQIMFAMVELSFGNLLDNGTLVGKKTGISWDMQQTFPTVDDFYNEMVESYGGSAETYWAIEGIGRGDILELARLKAVQKWAAEDASGNGGVVRIPGIVRVGDRMATIRFAHMDAAFIEAVAGLIPVPRHIFACDGMYDYASGSYGFPKGRVSKLPTVTGVAVGLGAYAVESYEDGKVVLVQRTTGEKRILARAAG